jgi:hypothetical protein
MIQYILYGCTSGSSSNTTGVTQRCVEAHTHPFDGSNPVVEEAIENVVKSICQVLAGSPTSEDVGALIWLLDWTALLDCERKCGVGEICIALPQFGAQFGHPECRTRRHSFRL